MKTETTTIKNEIKAMLKYVSRKEYNIYVLREMLNQITLLVEEQMPKPKYEVNNNE